MPLTTTAIKNAKPGDKTKKLYDARGLYLEIPPRGGKWWRFKYRFKGKEKRISLGTFPDVGLADAREQRDEQRKLLAKHIDPSVHRQAAKASDLESSRNTFEVIAREWLSQQVPGWTRGHSRTVKSRLEQNVFPYLGTRPIAEISPQELLNILRRIEARGAIETAHRVQSVCGQIFRYAIATSRAERDIAADLKGALQPIRPKHFPAVVDPDRLGALLRAIDAYDGTIVVKCALRLAPLVFVRPGELRTARWADIDFDASEWRFEISKTKTPHVVPLATQAIEILKEVQPMTGRREYVFPSARSPKRPMSDNAILAALRRMDIPKEEMTGHGFRATARTLLDEVLEFRPDIIEHQLAHRVKDPLGRAYNRTAHLEERRKMMQCWADYLDELRSGDQQPSKET